MLPSLDAATVRDLALSLAVLLSAARLLGHLARRVGVPPVVGELGAGVLLGPTVLGLAAPGISEQIVPPAGTVRAVLDGLAWLGVMLLLASAGAQLDPRPLLHRPRTAWIAVLSFAVPVGAGFIAGWFLPASLAGSADRAVVAAMVAVILGISALPTIARTLKDLELEHRDVGQLTLASAALDDLVGWLLLAVLTAGVVGGGAVDVAVAALQVTTFLAVAWLLGARAVDLVLGLSVRMTRTIAGPATTYVGVIMVTVVVATALDLEAVVGALVAGIILGRSPLLRPGVQATLDEFTAAALGPLFFALAGAAVDLRAMAHPTELAWTAGLVAVAIVAKVGGATLGAQLAGLDRRLGTAVGIGLSARGGLGIVVAAVALSVGVLSEAGYAAAVVMAVATSLVAPPLLSRAARDLTVDAGEQERLAWRAVVERSPAVGARRVLLLTRGGANSRVAARVLDLALEPSAAVTVLVVVGPSEQGGLQAEAAVGATPGEGRDRDGHRETPGAVGEAVASLLGHRRAEVRVLETTDVAGAICAEAERGYDLIVAGASGEVQVPAQLGAVMQQLMLRSQVPVLLVRSRTDAEGLSFRRLLTATDGTVQARGAEDVAFSLARSGGADVDVLHVIDRPDRILHAAWFRNAEAQPAPRHLLADAAARGSIFGVSVTTHTRVGGAEAEEFLAAGRELQADTLVLATTSRSLADRPFLGHGVEFLLEHATQNLVVLCFPTRD